MGKDWIQRKTLQPMFLLHVESMMAYEVSEVPERDKIVQAPHRHPLEGRIHFDVHAIRCVSRDGAHDLQRAILRAD